MPIRSLAQNRAMHAAASGNSTLDIPQSVGQDFVAAGPAGGSFKKLPERKEKKKPSVKMQRAYARGMVSDKAMKKAGY